VAAHRDPELLADGAAVAVGGDEVLRADAPLRATLQIPQRDGDSRGVLCHRGALDPVAQLGSELLGAGPQDGLERVLVDEQPNGWAELIHARVEVREVARDLASRQRFDVVDAAVRVVLLLSFAPDYLLQPGRAQDLDRAQLEVAGARMDRCARVTLYRQAADSVDPQPQRGGESNEAAADDQDVGLGRLTHGAVAVCTTVSTSSR
jgi:hypothetical protein